MAEFRELTNAEYAGVIAGILRLVSEESIFLARGMWNPNFCAASADPKALEEIEAVIQHYRAGGYRAMGYDRERDWYDTSLKEDAKA